MPLNKLDNFLKNTEGRILYVSPSDIDATDSILNTGNSLARPFKTLQRALIEAARFSYVKGRSNDTVEKTTILLMPGEHEVDNRPGWIMFNDSVSGLRVKRPDSAAAEAVPANFALTLDSNFDLTQSDNHLYRFNSVNGGVIVPRGVSIVGLDLRKTKIRPKYVPNPTDSSIDPSAIFRITGACYFWQFCIFDADEFGSVYTSPTDFGLGNQASPTFSHHKLTVFEYADGVNEVQSYGLTDLEMYYAKLSNAYGTGSDRDIDDKFPADPEGFAPQRPEYEIVGAFADDPIQITRIEAGTGGVVTNRVTVTTNVAHGLKEGTPIRISGVGDSYYNITTKVSEVDPTNPNIFYYNLLDTNNGLISTSQSTLISGDEFVTVETDTVTGASPYIFNISMRSVWGMNGMHADGSKATGFRSMVVAQFTGVSLQKDDRAFVKYDPDDRDYGDSIPITLTTGTKLSQGSSSTGTVYHLDSDAIYRSGWESTHIKASNDAFIQIVSVFAIGYNKHFESLSGGDLSITNSNSNFGQISLSADGFKKEAFDKDNRAFITHIVPPRAIELEEQRIDWFTIDKVNTQSIANNARLYIFGFESEDTPPPSLTQGYRVGAKINDKLFLDIAGTERSADIRMSDGSTSSVKEYGVGTPASNVFTLSSGTHTLTTGEKVIIISDTGDLPENLKTNTVYYAIVLSNTTIKLAASLNDADNDDPITVVGGTSLRILSRVSDKDSGDIGHPVQWDSTNNQWYINTNANSEIYQNLGSAENETEPTFLKRIEDSRSIDEKIYKVRIVVPKELTNAKTPENGYIIQESSSTGVRGTDGTDFTLTGISTSEYDYNRNPRFISTCSRSSDVVTVITELPHNLDVNDSVIIRNVTDTSINTGIGTIDRGYNGTFDVASVIDDMTFTYSLDADGDGVYQTPGGFTNNTGIRTDTLPRFERNNLKSNFYVYRSEVIQEYVQGERDGIYHAFVCNASNSIPYEFTTLNYSQNVVDFYPQLDRDNINDNPPAAKSYAKVSPLGEVVTNDLKKSITRETTDKLVTKLGIGLNITSIGDTTTTTPDITFERRHGLCGIVTGTLVPGSANDHVSGTYHNVKLYNEVGLSNWNGATASVVVSSGGTVTNFNIISFGSGYTSGTYFFDTGIIGGSTDAGVSVTLSGISTAIGDVVQFTGAGTTSDTYHRISAVNSATQISIARTTGDPIITTDHYAFIVGPSLEFTSVSTTGVTTITASGHGLSRGNRITILDTNNNNQGEFIVDSNVGVNTFTILSGLSTASGFVLKHGLSSNEGSSNVDAENLGARAVAFYDNETLTLDESITDESQFLVSVPNSGIGTMSRFPLGSYIQIDSEIMRVADSSLLGALNNEIKVIRGALATRITSHTSGSIIKKVDPVSVEFRRPSIIRASGHTFEYLGYGPGNYSTGLPQVQVKSLPEKEEFLVQSQERSAGIVVYTGMNNRGDFFIGNQKKSSATGEEVTIDTPIPTVTGENPARLSGVFDEITVKERIVVEGGASNLILSQFDGPVTFNGEVRNTNRVKITDSRDSTSPTTGALVVTGGLGIGKNVNIGGSMFFPDDKKLYFGNDEDLEIYHNGSHSFIRDTGTGNFYIDSVDGSINLRVNSTENAVVCNENSSVQLFHNNSEKLETLTDGVDITGTLYVDKIDMEDSQHIYLGTGDDLDIYHSGSHSFIRDIGSGNLYIDSVDGSINLRVNDNENSIVCNENGSVELYYNNSKKFETTNAGVKVTGIATVTSNVDIDGNLDVDGTTDLDTTNVVGTLTVTGQANIDNININGNQVTTSSGDLTINAVTGSKIVINKPLSATGITTFTNTTQNTLGNVNTGSVQFDGGVGIAKNLSIGGNTNITGTINVGISTVSQLTVSNLTNDRVVIAGTGGKLEDDANLTFVAGTGLTIGESKASNSTTTGALVVTGGVGVGGKLNVGGGAQIDNIQIGVSGNNEIDTSTGNLTIDSAGGKTTIDDHFAVTGVSTFTGNIDADGDLDVDGTTNLDTTNVVGTLTVTGQVDIDEIRIDGDTISNTVSNQPVIIEANGTGDIELKNSDVTINNNTPSSSTTEGALVVTGGVGIGGKLYVGNNIEAGAHTVTAATFSGNLSGNATSADTVDTTATDSTSNHFLIFADSSSTTAGETMRVCSSFYLKPNTSSPGDADLFVRGDITAFAGAASDDRLKTNREVIPNALEKVLSLSGFTFTWNEKAVELGFVPEVSQVGVSAQQVQSVLPEAVKQQELDGEEILTVKYEKLVPILIEAIKELNAKVEALEQKLSDK